jgi:hypothetical protein
MLNLFLLPATIKINYQKLKKKLMGRKIMRKIGKIKKFNKINL